VFSTQKERIEKYPKKKKARLRNVEVVECIEGRYESEKVPFGWVYRWRAACVAARCGCGESVTLSCSMTTCPGCGTDHAAIVQEWLISERRGAAQEYQAPLHPWRQARDRDEGESLPC
jgi:hypothetical protein